MYSVVLMMALSTSAEAPELGRRNCHGCSGGCSGVFASCHGGYSCGGGYRSCHGCSGGYRSCHGCSGGRVYDHGGCCGGGASYRTSGTSGVYYRTSGDGYDIAGDGAVTGTRRVMPNADTETRVSNYPADTSAATITVRLPEPGQLIIDDYQVPVITDRHVYITTPLGANESREVNFKTYIMKGGAREVVTKKVTVKPGQKTEVNLGAPASR